MLRTEFAGIVGAVVRAGIRRGALWAEQSRWDAIQSALEQNGTLADTSATSMDPYAGDDGLSRVATVFRLNSVERHLLVIAAAPDLDPVVAAAFGALQGRAGAQPATIALALELAGIPLLSGPGRALLGRSGTLLHWGLVQTHGGPMQLNRNLSVPEDVLGTLLNHPVADALSAELSLPIPDFETGRLLRQRKR